ncbi:MAG: alpha/beta hydrolase [Deltaproteobacteria bacterium]|nr:alpha/beta hydrolase [Deltaproteobacteria bacterium]
MPSYAKTHSPGLTPHKKGAKPSVSRGEHSFIEMEDGTELSVRFWQGPNKLPTLVLCDGLGCDGYVWRYLIEEFAGRLPILHWQYRGHGDSEVPENMNSISMQCAVDDLRTVLDHFGKKKNVILLGHSMGVQVCLEAYRQLEERIAGLGLFCGSYEHPMESFHGATVDGARKPLKNKLVRRLVFPLLTGAFIQRPRLPQKVWGRVIPRRALYEFAIRTEVNGERLAEDDFWPYFTHLAQMDMGVFSRFARSLAKHSAKDVLSDVKVPTLVIGAGKDTFTPGWRAERMHHEIDESDFLYIVDGTHTAPVEHPELVNLRFEKFLRERFGLFC